MNDRLKRIQEISDELKSTDDVAEKERLTQEFWTVAITEFNENIAGTIVTATGVVLHTPTIEL